MKKLLNNRGSALFMVLSVMTVLIIAATSVYFVVWSNQTTAYTHYEGEQAYQTAYSVSNAVSDYIDSYFIGVAKSSGSLSNCSNSLVRQMMNLTVGDPNSVITTTDQSGGSGLNASLANLGMGEYSVEIRKVKYTSSDVDQQYVFEIKTSSEVNGETVTITQYKNIATGPVSYFTRLFTSTGKSQNDVILKAQRVLTPLYFENDYSSFTGMVLADLISSGSLNISGVDFKGECDIYVASNLFTQSGPNPVCDFGGNVYVGGDLIDISTSIDADEVYVIGDMKLSGGGLKLEGNNGTRKQVFVNGNLTIDNIEMFKSSDVYVNGNLTINHSGLNADGTKFMVYGTVTGADKIMNNFDGSKVEQVSVKPWPADDVALVAQKIAAETARNNYAKWDASASCKNSSTVVKAQSNTLVEINDTNAIIESSDASNSRIIINALTHDVYVYLKPDANGRFQFTGSSSQVLVNGKYAVVFVLPEEADFVQADACFIGHAGWLYRYNSSYTLGYFRSVYNNAGQPDASKFQGIQLNTGTVSQFEALTDTSTGIIQPQYVNTSGANGNESYLHNNIFIVSAGKENIIDFSGSQSTFTGFVYARDSIFRMSCDSKFGIGGGVIAGAYEFGNANTSTALYLLPYDYYGTHPEYDPMDLIKAIMGDSGAVMQSTADSLQSWGTLAYK